MDTLSIISIKSKNDEKSDKDGVNIKLRRDTMLEKSDIFEIKMAFFHNDDPQEFCCSYGTFK